LGGELHDTLPLPQVLDGFDPSFIQGISHNNPQSINKVMAVFRVVMVDIFTFSIRLGEDFL
jgi:hypothetical protein